MSNSFKGIDLDAGLKPIVPHMAMAQEYGGALQQLQTVWDNLSLLGQLAGTGIDISNTRRAFSDLASDLLNQLGTEALKKCLQDAKLQGSGRDQHSGPKPVRADRGYRISRLRRGHPRVSARSGRWGRRRRRACGVARQVRRVCPQVFGVFRRCSARLRTAMSWRGWTTRNRSPSAAIRSCAKRSRPGPGTSSASARPISFPNGRNRCSTPFACVDNGGSVLGVLCLIFRFENEMELIFSKLVSQDDWTVVTILDDAGAVIASSDPVHIPIGVTLTPVLDADYRIVKFGPMEYIATSRAAKPYQGYGGPTWYGHVMVPIQHAFDPHDAQARADIETDVLEAIAHSSDLFSDAVRHIPSKAERILRDLNQSLWNGRMSRSAVPKSGAPDFSRVLLKEISDTGARTKDVFSGSIGDLHQTVVTSLLHDNQSQAALAIDIMDRNLYERANDCRWWALASIFSEQLSGEQLFRAGRQDDRRGAARDQRSLHGLYQSHRVRPQRQDRRRLRPGKAAISWARCSSRNGCRAFSRFAMRRTTWCPGSLQALSMTAVRPTSMERRSVRLKHQQAVGGVAIVFDAEPQFAAMLTDALPRDSAGNVKDGAFGVFVELGRAGDRLLRRALSSGRRLPDRRIRCCNSSADAAGRGSLRSAMPTMRSAPTPRRDTANTRAPDDAYQNDVIALIFTRLCGVDARRLEAPIAAPSVRSDRTQAGRQGGHRDLPGRAALARGAHRRDPRNHRRLQIVPLPCMPAGMVGCVMYRGSRHCRCSIWHRSSGSPERPRPAIVRRARSWS